MTDQQTENNPTEIIPVDPEAKPTAKPVLLRIGLAIN